MTTTTNPRPGDGAAELASPCSASAERSRRCAAARGDRAIVAVLGVLLAACGGSTGGDAATSPDVVPGTDAAVDVGADAIPAAPRYFTCEPDVLCLEGTTCLAANVTTMAGSRGTRFCTTTCTTSATCPRAFHSGNPGVCVTAGGVGECYEGCTSVAECGIGFTCAAVGAGTLMACVP